MESSSKIVKARNDREEVEGLGTVILLAIPEPSSSPSYFIPNMRKGFFSIKWECYHPNYWDHE